MTNDKLMSGLTMMVWRFSHAHKAIVKCPICIRIQTGCADCGPRHHRMHAQRTKALVSTVSTLSILRCIVDPFARSSARTHTHTLILALPRPIILYLPNRKELFALCDGGGTCCHKCRQLDTRRIRHTLGICTDLRMKCKLNIAIQFERMLDFRIHLRSHTTTPI